MKRPDNMPFDVYKREMAKMNKRIKAHLRGRTIFNNATLIGSTQNIK